DARNDAVDNRLPEYTKALGISRSSTGEGFQPGRLPDFKLFMPVLWLYLATVCNLPELWKAATRLSEKSTSNQRAKVLRYATKKVLRFPCSGKSRVAAPAECQGYLMDIGDNADGSIEDEEVCTRHTLDEELTFTHKKHLWLIHQWDAQIGEGLR
ncbi:hypothetical protein FOL47_005857, partial [Perkinsus chesapeaki]